MVVLKLGSISAVVPGPVFDPRVRAHFPEQRLVIEPMLKSTLTVVVLTLSGSSRDIHQT